MDSLISFIAGFGISSFQATCLVRLVLAAICGGLVGLEREMKGRPAGLKTFSLVCMGATLAMLTNEFIYASNNSTGDAARMAAQVISGIGFLGAGTIMVTRNDQIKGLTTAAALWVTASLGIAIGTGLYFGALAGLVILYLTSFLFRYLDKRIMLFSRSMRLYAEGESEEFLLLLTEYFSKNGIVMNSFTRKDDSKILESDVAAMVELNLRTRRSHKAIVAELSMLDGVRYITEI